MNTFIDENIALALVHDLAEAFVLRFHENETTDFEIV